ncbi:asparagine synthase (glutamine-hydrolyzing) [Streptomyces sp. NPDC004647]|uniref:asparagine synthase (glutamine-hydrolyzing) n=1 Tax=Streptomyces sp. NPDC004647 TaxID=3154671 RepID=UPI00339E52FB
MCGIVGVVDLAGRPLGDSGPVGRMLPALAHRGPDGQGELRTGPVWFGHTRLAILDPDDRSAQPMTYHDGDLVLTYNGEIVNYRYLRSELRHRGYRFTTRSDTEVLLAAYHAWGEACLPRLAGMFAFALYDRRTGETLLVRDRLGVKPLYYGTADGRLAFCSEPKGVLALPGVDRGLNPSALSSFFSFRHPLTEDGYFQGVRALHPGHLLRIRDGRAEVRRWWSPGGDDTAPAAGHGQLGELMGEVVRETAVSDVPVAVLLSGGLDSSVIALELARDNPGMLAVTASLPGAGYDEVADARVTAQALGARHLTLPVTSGDYLAEAAGLTRLKDQPLGMHNEVALTLLARHIKPHASVVLSGEGADELFAGYGRIFRLPFDARRLDLARKLPPPLRRRLLSAAGMTEDETGLGHLGLFLSRYCYWPQADKLALFTDEMREAVADDLALVKVVEHRFDEAGPGLFHQLSHFFVTTHLRGLLEVMDAAFMAEGVEVRVPFTDHRIVAAALSLPERDRLRWRGLWPRALALGEPVAALSERRDVTKYALRQAYRHRLPPGVTTRRKLPFPVPLSRWLLGERRAEVDKLLFGPDARIGAIFDQGRLRRWLSAADGRATDTHGRQVWLLIGAELWLRQNFPDGVSW